MIALPPTTWHRPLLWLAIVMGALALFCVLAMPFDSRTSVGVEIWEKPLKFAVSVGIYAVTWSWLLGQLPRFRRLAWWAGTVSAVLLVVEMVIIVGAAAGGIRSHFNVSTPVNTVLWAIMAFSISAVWVATFVVSVLLFRAKIGDAARTLAVRAGAVIALAGMALAFLMTGPTAAQLKDFQGIAGAHTVGVADGGPGLPLLGWSTVAGDLRIPHFVGMHALQAIPIALILLEVLARWVPRVRVGAVRYRLVATLAATYVAVLGVLTWQAERGQSIVRPDALTLVVVGALALLAAIAVAASLLVRTSSSTPTASGHAVA